MRNCFIIDKNLSPNSFAFLYPILLNKDKIENKIDILFSFPKKNYDLIFVDSKYYNKKFQESEFDYIKSDLINLKKKCNKLIYCDNEASIFINETIFDFVDTYLKGRLPRNINIYKKKLYGQREFTDYYHKKYNIIDDTVNYSNIIGDKKLNKLVLGWNNGICDYSYYSPLKKKLFKLTGKIFSNKIKFNEKKEILISGRFKQKYNRNSINFHRDLFESVCKNICDTSRVSRLKYFNELKKSIFSISPFGWGEICYRDFESFTYSCILLKPNMDHIMTWPEYYIKNETYIPLDWDQPNSRQIERILDEKDNYKNIAEMGYVNYLKYFDNTNKFYFKKKLEKIINIVIN